MKSSTISKFETNAVRFGLLFISLWHPGTLSAESPLTIGADARPHVELRSSMGGIQTASGDLLSTALTGLCSPGLSESININFIIMVQTVAKNGVRDALLWKVDIETATTYFGKQVPEEGVFSASAEHIGPDLVIHRETRDRWLLKGTGDKSNVILNSKEIQILYALMQKAQAVMKWLEPKIEAFNSVKSHNQK